MTPQVKKAIQVLKSGGVLIYPTDTVYGIGCDARNTEAVKKIFALKKRSLGKGFPLIGRLDVLEKICTIPIEAKLLIQKFWPGTLTIKINPHSTSLISPQVLEDNSIAIRIPNHPFVLELLKHLDFPIVSTSVNISGEPSPTKFSEIKIKADLNIEGDKFVQGIPSTLIDFRQKPFKIIRQGAVKI